jgi:UDP-GlcNAc3NAcA epimerase
MKVLSVVGNRPQFVKAAPTSVALRERGIDEIVLHTGQHYDRELSQVFFEELGLDEPRYALDLHTADAAEMEAAIAGPLEDEAPDWVLVYGDTNSTLAGALAASQAQIPVAHVEAGMRSFDRAMPEEVNRVLTDHLGALLLCPSQTAVENLRRESVAGAVELAGDVMVDVAALLQPAARARTAVLEPYDVEPGGYLLATAHRAGNVDDPERLAQLADLLRSLPLPTVLPLHPRTRARLEAAGLLDAVAGAAHIRLAPPLGYLDFTALLCNARAIVTDSGGVQKEAYLAGVACVTLRPSTEWVETVEVGWNVLVDLDADAALAALERTPPVARPELYGDGRAGERVAAAIRSLAAPAAV